MKSVREGEKGIYLGRNLPPPKVDDFSEFPAVVGPSALTLSLIQPTYSQVNCKYKLN